MTKIIVHIPLETKKTPQDVANNIADLLMKNGATIVGPVTYDISDGKPRITFGKYKGKTYDEVPSSYLDWLRDQDWVKSRYPDLYNYINKMGDHIDKEIEDNWADEEVPF